MGGGADNKWSSFDVEVWCDPNHRPMRINNRLGEALGGGSFWVTTELWDFRTDVQVPSGIPASALASWPRLSV
jgi:hypothetical protein